jgi:hypothetical protein
VVLVEGKERPPRGDAAGFQKQGSLGKCPPLSLSYPPTQWIYEGRDLCGCVEVTDSLFIAIDVDERVIGRFKALRQATRALPAAGDAS